MPRTSTVVSFSRAGATRDRFDFDFDARPSPHGAATCVGEAGGVGAGEAGGVGIGDIGGVGAHMDGAYGIIAPGHIPYGIAYCGTTKDCGANATGAGRARTAKRIDCGDSQPAKKAGTREPIDVMRGDASAVLASLPHGDDSRKMNPTE